MNELTNGSYGGRCGGEQSEKPMKQELQYSANRHARKLIKKLSEIIDLPSVACDSIHQECSYATMDGYRITMRHQTEMETGNDSEEHEDSRFNK